MLKQIGIFLTGKFLAGLSWKGWRSGLNMKEEMYSCMLCFYLHVFLLNGSYFYIIYSLSVIIILIIIIKPTITSTARPEMRTFTGDTLTWSFIKISPGQCMLKLISLYVVYCINTCFLLANSDRTRLWPALHLWLGIL